MYSVFILRTGMSVTIPNYNVHVQYTVYMKNTAAGILHYGLMIER